MTPLKPDKCLVKRVARAIRDEWHRSGEVPFPLYPHEAEELAKAAIAAMSADDVARSLGRDDREGETQCSRAEIEHLRADNAVLQNMLDKIAKHPDTPELLKQYAKGMLHPDQAVTIAKVSK